MAVYVVGHLGRIGGNWFVCSGLMKDCNKSFVKLQTSNGERRMLVSQNLLVLFSAEAT